MLFNTYPALTTVARMLQTLTCQMYDHLSTLLRKEIVEATAYTANPFLFMLHTE